MCNFNCNNCNINKVPSIMDKQTFYNYCLNISSLFLEILYALKKKFIKVISDKLKSYTKRVLIQRAIF